MFAALVAMAAMTVQSVCLGDERSSPESDPETRRGHLVDTNEYSTVLGFISAQISANVVRIKTWSGQYGLVDTRTSLVPFDQKVGRDGGRFVERDGKTVPVQAVPDALHCAVFSGVVDFVVDVDRNELRSDIQQAGPVEYFAVDVSRGVRELVASREKLYAHRNIVTSEHWIHLPVNERLGQLREFSEVRGISEKEGGRVARRKAVDDTANESEFGKIVDPRELFGVRGTSFADFCDLYRSALDGERTERERELAGRNVQIQRRDVGDQVSYIVTVVYRDPSTDATILTTETTFDGSVGFNATRWRQVSSSGRDAYLRTFTYAKIDGIYVPSRVTHEFFGMNGGGHSGFPIKRRELELTDAKVNAAIDQTAFERDQLGIEYGERMVDESEGDLKVFDGSQFVAANGFVFDAAKAHEPQRGSRLKVVVINVVCAFVVLSLAAWYRWKRKPL